MSEEFAYECERCGPVSHYSVYLVPGVRPGGAVRHDLERLPHEAIRRCEGRVWATDPKAGQTTVHTRATLHARIADVLRRSGVADAEQLVRLMEQDAAETRECTSLAEAVVSAWASVMSEHNDTRNAAFLARRLRRALLGAEIGPPK